MESDRLVDPNSAQQGKRRPYHYTNTLDNSSINASEQSEDFWSERANYSRYLYYNRLRRDTDRNEDDILLIPPHVIPGAFFYPQFMYSPDGKQSSLVTIFALWNTMMGTSLLSMPWALEKAGAIPGIVLLCVMAGLCFYTACKVLETFEAHQSAAVSDLAVLCKLLLGRWAQVMAVLFSAMTLLGASIVYWVLMSNFLYHTVDFVYSAMNNETVFNASVPEVKLMLLQTTLSITIGTFIALYHYFSLLFWVRWRALGPRLFSPSSTHLVHFLCCTYSFFVIVKWNKYGVNININDPDSIHYTPLYKSGFAALSGMLSLAFFIHNCIVTIMKNNRNPVNNRRDLGIAYLFVAATYCIIGGIFYLIFPLEKECIADNFLNNFHAFDTWSFTARIFLFFQMVTVFPLLVYILRVQFYFAVFKKNPNFIATVILNAVIISVCVVFAMKLPHIGLIIRFTGAVCGFVYLFFLPICLYLRWQNQLGTMTKKSAIFHGLLMSWSFSNLVLQFIVN